jgi:hypothetical protein
MIDTNDWKIWGFAFCKCLVFLSNNNQDELDVLLSTTDKWSILGARDAIDYFNTCNGVYEFLILANNEQWLKEYYNKIYSPNPKFNSDNYKTENIIDV